MRHRSIAFALLLGSGWAAAQDPDPVYQTQANRFGFNLDAFVRREWTNDVLTAPAAVPPVSEDFDRWVFRARPRVEFGGARFRLGVGGDFYYSDEDNLLPPVGQTALPIIRDNFDSRSARLDLAFAHVEPASWLKLDAGRFAMPVPFTEMIWDRDLRAEGGAAWLGVTNSGNLKRAGLSAVYSRGSHVFDDGEDLFDSDAVETRIFSGELTFQASQGASLQFLGSYVEWRKTDELEAKIRRQNSRVAGLLVRDYHVFDAVVRLTTGGNAPVQLVANMCWNVADDPNPALVEALPFPHGKKGLWLAAVLGSLTSSRARAEYTYAKIDRDATLAAYNSDDFFWGTGWEGHRGELATSAKQGSSVHAIGQWQRFKDSPVPSERDHWVKRFRIEIRISR